MSGEGTLLKDTARYGTVERKIREIAESIDGVNYLFNNWAQANVAIDHIEGPTIIYVLPPSGELDFHHTSVKDYPQCQIAFVASTEFDFDGAENDNIIERMKRLCVNFVNRLNKSGLFSPIEGRLSYRVLYDHFDQNVTGIVITPELIEEEGVIICEDVYRREDEQDIEDGQTINA